MSTATRRAPPGPAAWAATGGAIPTVAHAIRTPTTAAARAQRLIINPALPPGKPTGHQVHHHCVTTPPSHPTP
ncbi:MAG TPA: hypothetical protein VIY28_17695, partial [Pseudonocardiaceae bacterium]